jgi:ComEC/Rec2-related protein
MIGNKLIYVLIKYISRPSSWFLLLLTFAILVNCFLNLQSANQAWQLSQIQKDQVEILEFKVVDKQNTNFGMSNYVVLLDSTLWTIKSGEVLEIGKAYKGFGKLEYFNFEKNNKFENYQRSLGFQGKVSLKEINQKGINCDIVCSWLKMLDSSRRWVKSRFQMMACHEGMFIIDLISSKEQECQNVWALSYGLVLGGSNYFTQDFRDSIKKTGLSHLVAFSGFQVVLIASFVEYWLNILQIGRKWRISILILFLIITIFLVGPMPPVLRSSVSLLLGEGVLYFFGRRISSFRRLIYSGLILLLINPLYIINISFQLSFLATVGVIISQYFLSNISQKSNKTLINLPVKLLNILCEVLLQTLCATILTLPVLAGLNPSFSLVSIISNVIFVPYFSLITVLNIISLIPLFGNLVGLMVNLLQILSEIFINDLSKLDLVTFKMPNFSMIDLVTYYFVVIFVTYVFSQRTKLSNSIPATKY